MNKVVISILSILLLLTNVFWLYQSLDNGVSLTSMEASLETQTKISEQLFALTNAQLIGKSVNEVDNIVPLDIYSSRPFIKDDCLNYGSLCLIVGTNGTIQGVK